MKAINLSQLLTSRLNGKQAASRTDRLFAVRLMEHLVVPTFVLDASGNVMIWNRACERLTGVPAAELLGSDRHWHAFYDAPRACLADLVLRGETEDIAGLYAKHSEPHHQQAGISAENWCVMPQLGTRRYLAIDAGPIYSETGELLAVVETLRDITAQKEAQTALEVLASLDGLTGLANRRMFDGVLESECRRSKRDKTCLSLLLIDIDHFKLLNDTSGHQAGDECLKEVAHLIKGEMRRAGDLAARYGGEEFAVILPGAPLQGALVVSDRIMTALTAHAIPHPSCVTGGSVTLSIGIAHAADLAEPRPAELLSAADSALYRAKRQGRNQTVVAE